MREKGRGEEGEKSRRWRRERERVGMGERRGERGRRSKRENGKR